LQLHQLETFIAVAQCRSFTGAASKLNLTQPAISQHIKALEEEVGVRLVDRSTNPVNLTEAGLLLFERATELVRHVDDTRRALDDLRTGETGIVRLAAGSTTCIYALPELLEAFRAAHPRINIHISSGTTRDIVQLLERSVVDLGIVTTPVKEAWAHSVPLFRDEIVLVGTPGLLRESYEKGELPEQANMVTIGPEELENWPLVAFKAGYGFREFINQFMVREGLHPNIPIELDNIEAIKELVRVGMGLAFVPISALGRDVRSPGAFVRVAIRGTERLMRTTSMVRRRGRYVSQACRHFMGFVTRWFEDEHDGNEYDGDEHGKGT